MPYPHGRGQSLRGLRERLRGRAADRRSRAAARRWSHDGSEPRLARSDLPARRLLAGVFAPLLTLGAVAFALLAADGPHLDRGINAAVAALCAVCAVAAVVDLLVIRRRMAEQRRWRR
ncbi:hypothetical protein ACEZCY_29060 [Streptacidiphilus sp. N1-12]|uniref:Uncharacterized protein n=2 Tax=Streptacidiphilus alkalitolerans TaxID=3342712 RepID=A0ABV6WND7_9ACTN